ncbi:MAG: hypothetical protein Q9213_008270 [Squamulea squamosa]
MSDIPAFLAFASNGSFVDPSKVFVPLADTDVDLSVGINTFVTSKFMQAQGLYAVPGEIMNASTYATKNGCPDPTGTICFNEDERMLYWSPATHRSYELEYKGKPRISRGALLDGIDKYGYADAELLFDGNYNCTMKGRAGQAIVDVATNRTDAVDSKEVLCGLVN